jgi:hypothetical protein
MIGHVESLGDGVERRSLDKKRPQGFITALKGLCGFEKETAADDVLHDPASELRVLFPFRGGCRSYGRKDVPARRNAEEQGREAVNPGSAAPGQELRWAKSVPSKKTKSSDGGRKIPLKRGPAER